MPNYLNAGQFSIWLENFCNAQLDVSDMDVPCEGCTACCRSSLFIHIQPQEADTLKRIPKALQFPAPGLPQGHVVLGFKDDGHCPMFLEGACSIYDVRPVTCRKFDCRVLKATGLYEREKTRSAINIQAKRWRFDLPTKDDQRKYKAVQSAANFLKKYASEFPEEIIPQNETRLAVFSIKVYEVFLQKEKQNGDAEDAAQRKTIVESIVSTHANFESQCVK